MSTPTPGPTVDTTFVYTPADPASVTAVPTVALFRDPARSGQEAYSGGPAVRAADGGSYSLHLSVTDGTYWPSVTVAYADGTSEVDRTGPPLTVPAARLAGQGEGLVPWVSVTQLQALPDCAGIYAALLEESAQAATEVLWALSGRRFGGERLVTLHAVVPGCSCLGGQWTSHFSGSSRYGWDPRLQGVWQWGWGCGCEVGVTLPHTPVRSIRQVRVGAAVIDPAAYRLDDRRRLVRVDGEHWPLWAGGGGRGEAGPAMQVTYTFGTAPSVSAQRACRALAAHYAKRSARGGCALPERTRQVSSQGVSVEISDYAQFKDGGTGVPEADAWLASVNPDRLSRGGAVRSVDQVRFRVGS